MCLRFSSSLLASYSSRILVRIPIAAARADSSSGYLRLFAQFSVICFGGGAVIHICTLPRSSVSHPHLVLVRLQLFFQHLYLQAHLLHLNAHVHGVLLQLVDLVEQLDGVQRVFLRLCQRVDLLSRHPFDKLDGVEAPLIGVVQVDAHRVCVVFLEGHFAPIKRVVDGDPQPQRHGRAFRDTRRAHVLPIEIELSPVLLPVAVCGAVEVSVAG